MAVERLPLQRAGELEPPILGRTWLIQQLWTRAAIGVVAGAPKSMKSWFVLEMATCVASGVPCLQHFAVDDPGPSLIYLAEDSLPQVQVRLASLCAHHDLDLKALDLHVITAPSLRLDRPEDQQRLDATVAHVKPRLLVLDPLVRLHRLNENDASEISGVLGYLRQLQRAHDVAVALVHHTSKKRHGQHGLALRGSSDLWAFTDSSAYLVRRDQQLLLTSEHRSAPAPETLTLELVSDSDGQDPHLELTTGAHGASPPLPLTERVVAALTEAAAPLTRQALRDRLSVNNQRLGDAVTELEARHRILRTTVGWTLPPRRADPPEAAPLPLH